MEISENFSYSSNARTNWTPRTAAAVYFNKSYDVRARANSAQGLSAGNMAKPKPDPVGFEAKNIKVYVAGNVSDNAGIMLEKLMAIMMVL